MQVFDVETFAQDEKIAFALDMVARKPSGGSVSSATGTITNPTGDRAALSATPSVSGDVVTATVTGGTDVVATGYHYLDLLVTLSNGEKPRYRVPLNVTV